MEDGEEYGEEDGKEDGEGKLCTCLSGWESSPSGGICVRVRGDGHRRWVQVPTHNLD